MIAATSPTADLLRLAVHAGTNVAALVDACLSLLPADHSAVIARPVLQQRHDVTSAALLHFGEEDGPAVQAAFGPATPARDLARKVVGTKRARAASTEDPDVRLCAITISSFILKRAAILFCDSLCAGSQECGPAHFLLWCTFCRQLKKHGQTQLMNSLLATYENLIRLACAMYLFLSAQPCCAPMRYQGSTRMQAFPYKKRHMRNSLALNINKEQMINKQRTLT